LKSYEDFTKEIKNMCNIDLSNYKEKQMKRRIDSLIRRKGHEEYSSYIKQLKQNEQDLNEFLGYMEWSSQTGHAKLFFSPLIAGYLINTFSFSVTQGDVYINWRLTLD
jgi:hypothetical protein